jgi:aspartate racemase
MSSEQRMIGIIGGVSWESTALYYRLINTFVRDRLGNLNSANIIMKSINYEPIVKLEQKGEWEQVAAQLGKAAEVLQHSGANLVILCCNTLHKVAPFIEASIEVPFLHIADAVGNELVESKAKKVGLLGTQFTMEDGFYASRLENKFGLEVIVPNLTDRKLIDHIIYQELCQGKAFSQSRDKLIRITQDLQINGAEVILLACTELSILISSEDITIPVFDTTRIHAEKAVNLSFSHSLTSAYS